MGEEESAWAGMGWEGCTWRECSMWKAEKSDKGINDMLMMAEVSTNDVLDAEAGGIKGKD